MNLPIGIGDKLINKAISHLKDQEFNSAILFSGMAMDCQLSELYKKWRDIRDLADFANPYDPEKTSKEIEEELKEIRRFKQRVARVTKLMGDRDWEDFIKTHQGLADKISKEFPNINLGSVVSDIEKHVMWKRNHIIHVGDFQYPRIEAEKCIKFSKLFLLVLEKMDEIKRREPDPKI